MRAIDVSAFGQKQPFDFLRRSGFLPRSVADLVAAGCRSYGSSSDLRFGSSAAIEVDRPQGGLLRGAAATVWRDVSPYVSSIF